MRALLKDFRLAWRGLAGSRGTSLAAVVCVALGIGAGSAVFTVVDAVLLRPLPFARPERLVWLRDVHAPPGSPPQENQVSPANFAAWRQRNRVFERMAAIQRRSFSLTSEAGAAEHLDGARVSADFFPLLGVAPALGRDFLEPEDRPGAGRVVVLSHGLWQRRFGSALDVLGETLLLDGERYTVVGVMPARFRFPEAVELWVPLALDFAERPYSLWHYLDVVALLRPEVSPARARAEMTAIARHLERDLPATNGGWTARMVGLREHLVGDVRPRLLALLAAVGLLLAVACANFANLLLARGVARGRELAVRAALGARRVDLVRRLLAESVLLALLGGALGLALAHLSLGPILAWSPVALPVFEEIRPDARVLAFALLASIATAVAAGLVPALGASRPGLEQALREGGRAGTGRRSRRLQTAFVITQVATATLLLVGAALLVRSFRHLLLVDPGFHRERVLALRVSLPRSTYPEDLHRVGFVREACRRLEALPGVETAAATLALPLRDRDTDYSARFSIEGRRPEAPGAGFGATYRAVTPGYFRAMGIPLLEGREFSESDDARAPRVVVLSRAMRERHWPVGNPIGRRLKNGDYESEEPWLTVVGVVEDVKDQGLHAAAPPIWYLPFAQQTARTFTLVLRTAVEPGAVAAAARSEIAALDGALPVYDVASIEEVVSRSLAQPRFSAVLSGLFSTLGLLLTAVGLYGVLSYTVSRSRHEIGVRMALGARARDVAGLFLRRGLLLVLCGLGLGAAGALALTRLISGLLYGVGPADPATFAGIGAVLTAVALLAIYPPARRAARVHPAITLRQD